MSQQTNLYSFNHKSADFIGLFDKMYKKSEETINIGLYCDVLCCELLDTCQAAVGYLKNAAFQTVLYLGCHARGLFRALISLILHASDGSDVAARQVFKSVLTSGCY